MPTFSDYLQVVNEWYRQHSYWRMGQAYFNVLYSQQPEMADQIRGGVLDPFYNDRRIPEFLVFVEEHWPRTKPRLWV